jgi:hypothetical protein
VLFKCFFFYFLNYKKKKTNLSQFDSNYTTKHLGVPYGNLGQKNEALALEERIEPGL